MSFGKTRRRLVGAIGQGRIDRGNITLPQFTDDLVNWGNVLYTTINTPWDAMHIALPSGRNASAAYSRVINGLRFNVHDNTSAGH